jgi:hypothetical protein
MRERIGVSEFAGSLVDELVDGIINDAPSN